MAYIEARIQEYLDQLDQNDSQENAAVIKNIQQKIEPLKPKFHIRKKFNQVTNQKISDFFYSWIFDNFKFDNFTLDINSSVVTRYDTQEGAKKEYSPSKKGNLSHHTLITFTNDMKLVPDMWLRSGDSTSTNIFFLF
ncbi:hypothetical protein AX766_01325 [Flavobacterium covae]|uniref:hypothetical protein n=1 Tax=Flavobacterium covae TaxID=2906076 RepID=UPI0007C1EF80|nr:hypothetical protein [Flavobacterium covae]AND63160.1 hypothetical protein AX766_01325 [Flavobacterium covae]